jgi:hypothetical protein
MPAGITDTIIIKARTAYFNDFILAISFVVLPDA